MSKSAGFDSLKENIREISRICASVPDEFRLKCFELLMAHVLKTTGAMPELPADAGAVPGARSTAAPVVVPTPIAVSYSTPLVLNSLVSALVRKIGLTADQFRQVVGSVQGNIVFLREPSGEPGARAQMDWALLAALRSGIVKGAFTVDPEEVRLLCQEKGVLDRRSFYPNFRKHAELFRTVPEAGGKPQPLSSKGITALGQLVKELAG